MLNIGSQPCAASTADLSFYSVRSIHLNLVGARRIAADRAELAAQVPEPAVPGSEDADPDLWPRGVAPPSLLHLQSCSAGLSADAR